MIVVRDNFFNSDELDTFNHLAKSMRFIEDKEVPQDNWIGYRTEDLYFVSEELLQDTMNKIIEHTFSGTGQWSCSGSMVLHKIPEGYEMMIHERGWHRDDSVFSGVVYLNQNPMPGSGTLIEKSVIDNKFNRLLIYGGNYLHRVQNGFGDLENARLTLTFFINKIEMIGSFYDC